MSKSMMIEEECGTVTRTRHPHRGYYAGDFSGVPFHAGGDGLWTAGAQYAAPAQPVPR